MRILIDEDMPYIHDLLSRLGEVTAVPGRLIPVAQLADAGALIMRSITKVNESLLVGRPIKFVGTATARADHVDGAWSKQAGTGFPAVPGCNTIAVVEYVFSPLLTLAEHDGFSLYERTMGVVGAGSIGRRLQARLEALGIKTSPYGPPRADRGDEGDFRSLNELVQHADILTFRTPLSKDDPHKTLHLTNEKLICSLKPGAILINACRGAVVDSTVLLTCLNEDQKLSIMLDAWEGESESNVGLLKKMDISTPHIVGYTLEGKTRDTTQVFEAYSRFIGHE